MGKRVDNKRPSGLDDVVGFPGGLAGSPTAAMIQEAGINQAEPEFDQPHPYGANAAFGKALLESQPDRQPAASLNEQCTEGKEVTADHRILLEDQADI